MKAERGAILIMVAISLLVLTAFSAIVLDYGVMWASRGQAQNAADAGALAAIITLQQDLTADVEANIAARKMANANRIWGAPPLNPDINVSSPLPSICPDGRMACVKVDVYRGGRDLNGVVHTNRLPMFFGNLLGLTSQAVNATATAEVGAGNASSCLKPWGIADQWVENSVPPNAQFDLGIDTYIGPIPGPGTGYRLRDIGTTVVLTAGDPNDAIAPGNYYEVDLTGGGGGTSEYIFNIENCSNVMKYINPNTPMSCPLGAFDPGCLNVQNGRRPNASANGAQYLIDADPYATINSSGVISGSCVTTQTCLSPFTGATNSPRIVPVALFDPEAFANAKISGNMNLPIVNIMAFFIQSVVSTGTNKGEITGVLCNDASLFNGNGGVPMESFLTVVGLIR